MTYRAKSKGRRYETTRKQARQRLMIANIISGALNLPLNDVLKMDPEEVSRKLNEVLDTAVDGKIAVG